MYRNMLLSGLISCMLAVVLGAFGAHVLKSILTSTQLQTFETGVRYQLIHGLALISLSLFTIHFENKIAAQKSLKWVCNLFIIGTILFSGSLYTLTLFSNTNFSLIRIIGPLTPLGGLCFMMGWFFWIRVVFLFKVDK